MFTSHISLLWVSFFILLLVGCSPSNEVMEDIRSKGKLIVLTRNSPTTYFIDIDDQPAGYEHDLTKKLAESLNVEVEYKMFDSIDDIFKAIDNGDGHIAAAGLTKTELRQKKYTFGPGYKAVQEQVICHRKSRLPETIEQLQDKSLLIIAASSYEESLQDIKKDNSQISWQTTDELSTEQVFEQINNKKVDCTVADSNIFSLNKKYYPELTAAFALNDEQQLAWVLSTKAGVFADYVNNWFDLIENDSTLAVIDERYYGYAEMFDFYDTHVYKKRIKQRLPKYKAVFKQTAEKYPFDWTLLAAQAYQESGWKPDATSPTGVRGMMMLTRRTAKSLGVTKRTDVSQSVRGGAKYLQKMLDKLPEEINESDKIWFALAAYNVGFAHLQDARKLAVQLNKNANLWSDMREILPLLSQKKYYKQLKYGYARGLEPVRYVDRIRYYRDILVHAIQS